MNISDLSSEQLLTGIWAALRRIETNLALPPAPLELPAINVAPPDLTDVVMAVNQLKPGVNADDIAAALARVLVPNQVPVEIPGIEEFLVAVKELSWRLQGVGSQAYGGGAVSFAPGQLELLASATATAGTTLESRLDYAARTDAQPVYVGHAAPGTPTSADWRIEKVTYDTDRPTRKQVLTGPWDNRAALSW